MSEPPYLVGLPSRPTESVDRDAAPSQLAGSHGRTDGGDLRRSGHLEIDPATNASPANEQDSSTEDEAPHGQLPHIYVVYWPDLATIKVGVTQRVRWEAWFRRGAFLVAVGNTCCMSHARKVERFLLDILAKYGARAFKTEYDARLALGRDKGGYTECYRLVQSPRYGDSPEHEYDFERAYGLIWPTEFQNALDDENIPVWPVRVRDEAEAMS